MDIRPVVPAIDLKRQYQMLRSEIDAAVQQVLAGGWYILGKQVSAFEEEFASYVGATHAVGVASGTDALSLALKAVGIRSGDEVITVSHTAVATVAGIEQAGAVPVFVDVEPHSLTLNPELLEAAISARTRAIVPVHLYGHPADMEAIMKVAGKHDVAVVEDCAQAHGALYSGKRVGTFGNAAAFSFYPTKNLGAAGDGGMVITSTPEVAQKLKQLRQYGWEKRYISRVRGGNSRLDELQAAVLRVKLKHLDQWNEQRRDLAQFYSKHLAGSGLVLPDRNTGVRHVFHLYVVRSDEREALLRHLQEHGIGAQVHYPEPVHLQPAYRDLGFGPGTLPETEIAAKSVLSLPIYPEMGEAEANLVIQAVKKFGGKCS